MPDASIFEPMNRIVEEVGNNPHDISRYLKAEISPAYLGINGLVARVGRQNRIALNPDQPPYQLTFAHHHENNHLAAHHPDMAGFLNPMGVHVDTDSFSPEYSRHLVAQTEKECNLVAADQMINTNYLLTSIGYCVLEEYQSARKVFWRELQRYNAYCKVVKNNCSKSHKARMQELHKILKDAYEKIEDLMRTFSYGDFMTREEIAGSLEMPVHYVDYKLEALRIQGYDIELQELVTYEKVFTKERRVANGYWYME